MGDVQISSSSTSGDRLRENYLQESYSSQAEVRGGSGFERLLCIKLSKADKNEKTVAYYTDIKINRSSSSGHISSAFPLRHPSWETEVGTTPKERASLRHRF